MVSTGGAHTNSTTIRPSADTNSGSRGNHDLLNGGGDPGAFMDRSVLESDQHRVIEGMAIAAYAVGESEASDAPDWTGSLAEVMSGAQEPVQLTVAGW